VPSVSLPMAVMRRGVLSLIRSAGRSVDAAHYRPRGRTVGGAANAKIREGLSAVRRGGKGEVGRGMGGGSGNCCAPAKQNVQVSHTCPHTADSAQQLKAIASRISYS